MKSDFHELLAEQKNARGLMINEDQHIFHIHQVVSEKNELKLVGTFVTSRYVMNNLFIIHTPENCRK